MLLESLNIPLTILQTLHDTVSGSILPKSTYQTKYFKYFW